MKNKITEVRNIPLSQIVPDENQPRKEFSVERLADLQKSIEAHGILTPLVVEKFPGGKFILVDGERRFRAAKELKLNEVPAVIQEPKSQIDRLIQQFHIQEQHQGWTNTEKAIAMGDLAKALNLNIESVAELLAIPRQTASTYVNFHKLMSRSDFQKAEISLVHSRPIVNIREFTKIQYFKQLEEEFDKDKQKDLEKALIKRIKSGEITRARDMAKLHDAIKINPKIVEKLINDDKVTIEKLYIDTKARVSFEFRNLVSSARQVASYVNTGVPLGIMGLIEDDEEAQKALRTAKAALDKVI